MPEKVHGTAVVLSQEQLAEGIYSLVIKTREIAERAKPGQFVSVYCNDASRLLPRPISLCEIDKQKGTLRLVYRVAGKGTDEFSRLKLMDMVRVLGPLGNGFSLEKKRAFLIGGGIGIPPLLELAKAFEAEKQQITAILGYRNADTFLLEDFQKRCPVYIATEDGSLGTKGNVLSVIRRNKLEADVVYACGPKPMLQAVSKYARERSMECYVSMEERMACGIGACLACVCKSTEKGVHTNVNNKRVCMEGPVFRAEEVDWS